LLGLALLFVGVLFSVHDPLEPWALLVRLLYPAGISGAITLLVYTVRRHPPGPRRWCWILQIGSMLSSMTYALLAFGARWTHGPLPVPLLNILFLFEYALALIGVAFYLPYRAIWTGTTLRVIVESAVVGTASLIILYSVLVPILFK